MSLNIRFTCMKVIPVALFLLILQPVQAQPDFSGLDQLLQKNQKSLGNSVVALVYQEGKLVYKKELGDLTAKMQVPLAHVGQWLTTAMVMTFVDQGKITLDDPVSKYLPTFNKYMKSYVTIRHCLSNTSGIEREQGSASKLLNRRRYESLEAEVDQIAAREISNNPGQEFFFGNYGFSIAARVCEVVGKKSFERLIQERITRPLKMRQTNFNNDNGYAPDPSAGGKSSPNDYMNFLTMLLNKGSFEERRILSEAAVAEMFKIQNPGLPVKWAPKAAQGFEYGLGTWIEEKDAAGNPTLISCPGFFGCWAYIDLCRKYAGLIFVSKELSEQKTDLINQFKQQVADELGNCGN